MSTPETDRRKRKAALKEARQKLALRKKQRDELRAQRAARLGGKLESISSSTIKRQASLKKQSSLLFIEDNDDDYNDVKYDAFSSSKTSLSRKPGKKVNLSMARLKHFNFTPESNIISWDKSTETDFSMFCEFLMEEFNDEFSNKSMITDEVRANLIQSKYKIAWPKEMWIHEKSLSPSPQALIYSNDNDFVQQQEKIQMLQKQEIQRKKRQKERISERRKLRLRRKNRNILPQKEADSLENIGAFMDNFREKTKWMERTLGINNSYYYNDNDDDNDNNDSDIDYKYDDDDDDNNYKQKPKNKLLLKYANKFPGIKGDFAETKNRAVCDINFSAINNDWFLASYFSQNLQYTSLDNDGLILIWNLNLPRFPEYKLYSESQITSTHFHPMHKFLVFAATATGQILCYDLRDANASNSNSKPVQRTNFNDAHCSPIYCMDFLSSAATVHKTKSDKQRRHILSLSNDGKLCIFKDDGLNVEAMHHGMLTLNDDTKYIGDNNNITVTDATAATNTTNTATTASASASSQELSTVCFGYPHKRSDNIIFGSDSGKLYRTDIHNKHNGSDDKIYVEQCIDAHFGPITNIHFPSVNITTTTAVAAAAHTAHTAADKTKDKKEIISNYNVPSQISGLYLTSSYDWTVKLWHADYIQEIETYSSMTNYVYDVKWCNGGVPGVFAACDGDHKLTLFDLRYIQDKEPVNIINVPTDESNAALTKLNWANNAKYLCCGDSNGTIYLYSSSPSLLNPQQNDIENLSKAINKMITSRQLTKQPK